MPIIETIAGFLVAAIGATLTVGNFLASVAFIPFKMADGNVFMATIFYWVILGIDSFFLNPVTGEFFKGFGFEGFKLGFSTIHLLILNIFFEAIFHFSFNAFILWIFVSFLLAFQFAFQLTLHAHYFNN